MSDQQQQQRRSIKSHVKDEADAKVDRNAARKEQQKLKRQERLAAKRSQWEDKFKDVKANDILVRHDAIITWYEGSKTDELNRPSFVQVVKVLEAKSDGKKDLGLRFKVAELNSERRGDYIYPGYIVDNRTYIISKADVDDYTLHEPGKEYHAPLTEHEQAVRDFQAQLKTGVIIVKQNTDRAYDNVEFQLVHSTEPKPTFTKLEVKRADGNRVVPGNANGQHGLHFSSYSSYSALLLNGWRIYDPSQVYVSLPIPPKVNTVMLQEDVKRMDHVDDSKTDQVFQDVANQLHASVMQFLHHVPSYDRHLVAQAVAQFYSQLTAPWFGIQNVRWYAFDIAHKHWLDQHPKKDDVSMNV